MLEQDIELRQMLNPGMTRDQILHENARAEVAQGLLVRRAQAGDRKAIDQIRTEQRELARMLARKQAEVEAKIAWLLRLAKEEVLA